MFEDLLPVLERGIMESAGSIPVVLRGVERSMDLNTGEQAIVTPSRHDAHELTYMRQGKAEMMINGKKVLVEKGACLVIRPGKPHTTRVLEGPADFLVVYFGFQKPIATEGRSRPADIDPAALDHFIRYVLGTEAIDESRRDEPFFLIKGSRRQDIEALLERIVRESEPDVYGQKLMLQLLAIEMMIMLARALREEWEESLRVRTGKARELVRIARDYIKQNHDRDLTVAEAAAYVFLSQGYFTRAFRDETGMSPMNYLMQVRVEHACRLLVRSDIKISGIARQVGFSSPQRFNAAFRKHKQMTPMEYRRRVLGKKDGLSGT